MINKFFQKACPQCLQHSCCRRGITAVEILVAVSVLVILVLIVLPQFSKIKENQVLKAATEDILSSLNKARSQTLASLNSSVYGVHFQSDKVIIFKGTSFSANDANNETINIVSPANISNVIINSVSGVSGEIYFNRLSGSLSNSGTNTITVSVPSGSKAITILATGAFSVN